MLMWQCASALLAPFDMGHQVFCLYPPFSACMLAGSAELLRILTFLQVTDLIMFPVPSLSVLRSITKIIRTRGGLAADRALGLAWNCCYSLAVAALPSVLPSCIETQWCDHRLRAVERLITFHMVTPSGASPSGASNKKCIILPCGKVVYGALGHGCSGCVPLVLFKQFGTMDGRGQMLGWCGWTQVGQGSSSGYEGAPLAVATASLCHELSAYAVALRSESLRRLITTKIFTAVCGSQFVSVGA